MQASFVLQQVRVMLDEMILTFSGFLSAYEKDVLNMADDSHFNMNKAILTEYLQAVQNELVILMCDDSMRHNPSYENMIAKLSDIKNELFKLEIWTLQGGMQEVSVKVGHLLSIIYFFFMDFIGSDHLSSKESVPFTDMQLHTMAVQKERTIGTYLQ